MSHETPIAGLRPLRSSDLDQLLVWRNHPDVRRHMYTRRQIEPNEHRSWFEEAHDNPDKHLFMFEHSQRPAGFVSFNVVAPESGRATWGFYLAPDALPGAGRLLGRLALAQAFERLGLHKICGEALAINERSIRFHERLGFAREAKFREHYFDGQQFHDVIGFGLLLHEWQAHKGSDCK